MTPSSSNKPTAKTTDASAVHTTALGHFLRATMVTAVLIMGFTCLQSGTAYFTASRSITQVESWFYGETLPDDMALHAVQKNLESVDTSLIDDASVKVALAKLYIVRAQVESSDVYFEAARKALSDARLMQPTHFEALSVQIFLDDYLQQTNNDLFTSLSSVLKIAPYEKEVQQLVGPILIKRWYDLPVPIQNLGKSLITSALREPDTREQMLTAMGRYKIAAPFTCCSPNRETSAKLRMLEAEAANAIYQ